MNLAAVGPRLGGARRFWNNSRGGFAVRRQRLRHKRSPGSTICSPSTLLEENRAWFLENEMFPSNRREALPRAVEEQCARVRTGCPGVGRCVRHPGAVPRRSHSDLTEQARTSGIVQNGRDASPRRSVAFLPDIGRTIAKAEKQGSASERHPYPCYDRPLRDTFHFPATAAQIVNLPPVAFRQRLAATLPGLRGLRPAFFLTRTPK